MKVNMVSQLRPIVLNSCSRDPAQGFAQGLGARQRLQLLHD